jgi:hypothetical protein
MSILKEKDLESGVEPFPEYVDEGPLDDSLPSEIRLPEPRPFLLRSLPPRHQLTILDLQSRFYYYWHYPIPLPASVERSQSRLQQWWHHPLQRFLSPPLDRDFQKWWLQPEHVWRRRRLRCILLMIVAYFFLALFLFNLDIVPPEVRRDVGRKWHERVGKEGCSGLACLGPAWEVGKEVVSAKDLSNI